MPLAQPLPHLQSLHPLLRMQLVPLVAGNFQSGWFAYVLGPWEPFKWTVLRDWPFLPWPQPTLFFTAISYEALFPCTGTLDCAVWPGAVISCSPGVPPGFYLPHVNVGLSILLASTTTIWPPPHHILCPCSPSVPLLPVQMSNSLNP